MATREAFRENSADRRAKVKLPDSVATQPERTIVDLNSDTPAKPIAIADDVRAKDEGQPTHLEYSTVDDDVDLGDVSDRTKKRIDRLKFETHTERRAREQAERDRDAALERARTYEAEVADLRRRGESGAAALANSMKAEREAKMADAKRRLSQAHADGDNEAIAAATADISIAASELTQIAARTPAPRPADQQQDRQVQQPQRTQAPQIAPNVTAWIAHNDRWFNKDSAKTKVALSIHEAVVARGIRPESPEYTQELDKGMQAMYPEHQPYGSPDGREQDSSRTPRRTNAVTEGGRDDAINRPALRDGQVELTAFQVDYAKKHHIPLDKFAAQIQQQRVKDGA